MAKMTDYELEQHFNDLLDEVYGTVMIAGMEYDTSYALRECDPIAYRVALSDYESELEQDEEDDE